MFSKFQSGKKGKRSKSLKMEEKNKITLMSVNELTSTSGGGEKKKWRKGKQHLHLSFLIRHSKL